MRSYVSTGATTIQEALAEAQHQELRKAWYRARRERLLALLDPREVLGWMGIDVRADNDRKEQIPCPFHGDSKPSARIYPANHKGPSRVWCFVCQEQWSAIELWSKHREVTHGQALSELEHKLHLPTPDPPKGMPAPDQKAEKRLEVEKGLRLGEKRLRYLRDEVSYPKYAILSTVLDQLWHRFEKGMDLDETLKRIATFQEKMTTICLDNSRSQWPSEGKPSSLSFTSEEVLSSLLSMPCHRNGFRLFP